MVAGTGRIQGDPIGTLYSLHDLARRMIVDSDNVAANLLLKRLGFETINHLMTELDAKDTLVERLFFDQAAIDAGKDIRTSPADLALLLHGLWNHTLLSRTGGQAILDAMAATTDHTKIPALLPHDVSVQNKTGAIPGVEHDAAIVTMPDGHQYIAVFMSDTLSGNGYGVQAIAKASLLVYNYESALP
jgi:beta-lactamase class A